jgi:hypothetical protein
MALAWTVTLLGAALVAAVLAGPSAAALSQRHPPLAQRAQVIDPSPVLVNSAITWAEQQIGAVSTYQNPYARWWSGYCEAFVERAYRLRFRYGSAFSDYRAEQRLQRVRHGVPPRGALVFYSGSYGHVALSVGGGLVISTIGAEADRLPVARVPYRWFSAPYLGWAVPIIR